MRDNYPDGQFENPDAPWNGKPEPEMIEFEPCETGICPHCGEPDLVLNDKETCQDCYEADPEYYNDEPDETPREDYDE